MFYAIIPDMKEVKKRILWVDIAKAIAILSVIISHTIELDSTLRVMIFSFHMPLFFILSGFTTHLAEDKKTLVKRLKKNIKYLLIPTFLILFIFALTEAFKFGGIQLWPEKTVWTFREFFLMKYPDGLYNASAVWFLVAMFWAKLIMDFVNIKFKTEKNGIIFLFLGMLGIWMGVTGSRLPFFVDLGFVATMFMEIGLLWRKYEAVVKKYTPILLAIAGLYWYSHTMRGDYLELWTRFYAGYEVSILTSIAGAFLVSNFAMMLEEALKKADIILKKSLDFFVLIGQNTLLLYLIHCLDTALLTNLWDVREGDDKGRIIISVILRVALNVAIFIFIKGSVSIIKNCSKRKRLL